MVEKLNPRARTTSHLVEKLKTRARAPPATCRWCRGMECEVGRGDEGGISPPLLGLGEAPELR